MSNQTQVDIAIRGGTIVTASSLNQTNIGISGEQIVQIGGEFQAECDIDASGLLVLPGGIDMHVHLTPVVREDRSFHWADDFASGTRAAAAGGITTVGNMTFPLPDESPLASLERTKEEIGSQALVDYVLHPVILDPSLATEEELDRLREAGHTTIKIFMVLSNFDGQAQAYLETMQFAADRQMLSLIHCEDGCIIGHITERLVNHGKTGPEWYPASRPVFSEEVAVTRAIGFAEAANAPMYVVHLSSQAGLEACHRARARGVPVYVETRPLYLYLTEELFDEPDGAKYVGNPPLRSSSDVEALWNGIWDGDIQTFCTDHAPWKLEEKLDPSLDVSTFLPGVADLETLMPMLFSEGVAKNRISIHRFVEVTSTNAARLFGLFPRKGTIAVGSDADFTIWDPSLIKTIDGEGMQTRADYSPYQDWDVTGWPVITISRGRVVFEHGEILASPGRGRFVPSGASQML